MFYIKIHIELFIETISLSDYTISLICTVIAVLFIKHNPQLHVKQQIKRIIYVQLACYMFFYRAQTMSEKFILYVREIVSLH